MPPIPVVLVAFAIGAIAMQTRSSLPPWPGAIALAGAIAVASVMARTAWRCANDAEAAGGGRLQRIGCVALAAIGSLATGFGYAGWRGEMRLADALPPSWEGEDIAVVGVIDELPRPGVQSVRFAFATERVVTPEAVVPARLSLAWYSRPPAADADELAHLQAPQVHAGERWHLTVRLTRPHGSVNPAGFDLEAWLFDRGFRATGYVRAEAGNRRVDAFAGRPRDYVERTRERVRDRIFSALPEGPYAGVLAALAIGDQQSIPQAQWDVFNRTGIAHLVSISGLHVTVFALVAGGIASHVLRRICALTRRVAARKLAVLVGLLACAGYVALAGAEVPALRTLAMLAVSAVGLWIGRPGTGRLVWLWSLAAVLFADPFAPLAAGFWLSFGAVGLLIYALGSRLRAPPRGRVEAIGHAVCSAARTQAVVTIGLVPLTLALFGQVSLVSPLANAIAIPIVTFAAVPLALVASALPFDALWRLAHVVIAALMQLLGALAAWPDSTWQQHAPLPWTIAAGTLAVMLLLGPRGLPGRGLGVIGLAPLALCGPVPPPSGAAIVTVLDVGQGLAVAVRTHARTLVYDTGPRYGTADAGARIIAPFLRAAGIPRLSMLMVSHRDTDHSGGALSLLAMVPVETLSSSLDDDAAIVSAQHSAGGAASRCLAGTRWQWDDVRFAILHPPAEAYAEAHRKSNDRSCVLRIETAHGRLLLTGDIEARSEYELVGSDKVGLRAEVLVVPHHGSRTSSTTAFIEAVDPALAIVTAGYRNRFGHPRPDVVARYRARTSEVLRTDRDGAVVLTFDRGQVGVQRWREVARRYWHARE